MKILLIAPYLGEMKHISKEETMEHLLPSSALVYLASFLRSHNHEPALLDLNTKLVHKQANKLQYCQTKIIEYIELDDRDYNCTGVEDESIDFAVSFGVFCHFPNSSSQTYINSVYDKLKPGGTGLIMFSDFHRHFEHSKRHFNAKEALLDLLTGGTRSRKTKLTSAAIIDDTQELAANKRLQDKYRESDSCGGWFWYDMDTINDIFENSN